MTAQMMAAAPAAGAPASSMSSTPGVPETSGMSDMSTTPDTPDTPDQPAMQPEQSWPADCKERFVFRAHGFPDSPDPGKYTMPAGEERVVTFHTRSPWTIEAVQLLQNRERFDKNFLIHHWMLYVIENDTEHEDGQIVEDVNQQSLRTLISEQALFGGVPGSGDMTLPDGVGLHLPADPNLMYALSIHYLNATSESKDDASGVELCVTDTKRPAEAAMHFIGKLSLELLPHAQTKVSTTCRPTGSSAPAHIITMAPHMHRLGRHTTLEIMRTSGKTLTLLDTPYDFDEQRTYDGSKMHAHGDLLLNAGDQLVATCHFDNTTDMTVRYGEASAAEMCFVNVLAWPVGSLSNHSPFATSLGLSGEQACLEL